MTETTTSHCCVYKNCTNSRKACPELSFYKFPVKDQDRCKEWLANCGNLSILNLNLEQKVICEKHFSPGSFRDYSSPRKFLNRNAVPLKYDTSTGKLKTYLILTLQIQNLLL